MLDSLAQFFADEGQATAKNDDLRMSEVSHMGEAKGEVFSGFLKDFCGEGIVTFESWA